MVIITARLALQVTSLPFFFKPTTPIASPLSFMIRRWAGVSHRTRTFLFSTPSLSTVKKASPFIFWALGRFMVGVLKSALVVKELPKTRYFDSLAPGKFGNAAPEKREKATPFNAGSSFLRKSRFSGE